jgi:hypothetical protein
MELAKKQETLPNVIRYAVAPVLNSRNGEGAE